MLHKLAKALPLRRVILKAPLSGVNGFTGRGDIRFTARQGGRKIIVVSLRGVGGRKAEIFANDDPIANVKIQNGRARARIKLPDNDVTSSLTEGASIEIRQNNDLILGGVLAQNVASRRVFAGVRDMLKRIQKQARQLWRSKNMMKSPKISPPSRKN